MCSAAACAQNNAGVGSPQLAKLEWLKGRWTRTNTKQGQTAFEIWQKTASGEFTGKGISMRGADTSFVEKLSIMAKDGEIYYIADVPENRHPVYFKFIELTDTSFVCENPAHDFPKRISYALVGSQLTAVISGDGQEIEFHFSPETGTQRD